MPIGRLSVYFRRRLTKLSPVPNPRKKKNKKSAGTTRSCFFVRSIDADGSGAMKPKVIREVVREAAACAGVEKLAPHDLSRNCASLCHLAGDELEQSNL